MIAPVGVPQPVGLVDHREIPGDALDLRPAHRRKLVRRDDDAAGVEEVGAQPQLLRGAERVAVHQGRLHPELGLELVPPLGPQRRGDQDQDPVPPLGGELGQDEPRLDRLPQPDLVGEDGAAGGQGRQGEGSRLDLVRVEVDRRVDEGRRQACRAAAAASGQRLCGDPLVETSELRSLLTPRTRCDSLRPHPPRLPTRPQATRPVTKTTGAPWAPAVSRDTVGTLAASGSRGQGEPRHRRHSRGGCLRRRGG